MKRWWRVLKFTALGLLGIAGVALIWLAVANAAADKRLERKLAELKAAGQPISLADLARKPIPPDVNAATFLRRAKSDVDAIDTAVDEAREKHAKGAQEFHEAMQVPAVLEAYRKAAAAHPDAWPLLEKASQCPQFDPQLDFTTDTQTFVGNSLLPVVQDERAAIRVLNYRALALAADGRRAEALDTCLAMFRLARHFQSNPTLVGFLVAMAVERVAIETTNVVLRSGPLPQSAYDELAKELARQDIAKAFLRNIVTERASCMQGFDDLPGTTADDQYSCLEMFEALSQWAAKPYYDHEARGSFDVVMARGGTMTKLLGPAVEATIAASTRDEAQLRALRILTALLAREQAGKTDEPKLSDLGLPVEATIDPFDGQPMRLKKTAGGWLIYSVGVNGRDDGGKLDDTMTDAGLGPPRAAPVKDQAEEK